jgi:hypothetical protein
VSGPGPASDTDDLLLAGVAVLLAGAGFYFGARYVLDAARETHAEMEAGLLGVQGRVADLLQGHTGPEPEPDNPFPQQRGARPRKAAPPE